MLGPSCSAGHNLQQSLQLSLAIWASFSSLHAWGAREGQRRALNPQIAARTQRQPHPSPLGLLFDGKNWPGHQRASSRDSVYLA